jgi:ABC-type antimicrobial peptide transport system permease subunit
MVLREILAIVAAGMALGAGLALAAGRVLRSTLFRLGAADPVAIGTAVALILAVTLLAGWLPARRASRLDPMSALRYE